MTESSALTGIPVSTTSPAPWLREHQGRRGSGNIVWARGEEEGCEMLSLCMRWPLHSLTHSTCGYVQNNKPVNIKHGSGRDSQGSIPTLGAIGWYWQLKESFFFGDVTTETAHALLDGLYTWAWGQHQLDSVILKKKNKDHEAGRRTCWEEMEGEVGAGYEQDTLHMYEILNKYIWTGDMAKWLKVLQNPDDGENQLLKVIIWLARVLWHTPTHNHTSAINIKINMKEITTLVNTLVSASIDSVWPSTVACL